MTESLHKIKWQHNRRFLLSIEQEFVDWTIISSFYAALHCVEMLFSYDGTISESNHSTRNRILKTTNRYSHIWKNYRPLHDAAWSMRYECEPGKWISPSDAKSKMIEGHLYQVEKSVLKLMGKDAEFAPLIWASKVAPASSVGDVVSAEVANLLPVGSRVIPSSGGAQCERITPAETHRGVTMHWQVDNSINSRCNLLEPSCDWRILRIGPATVTTPADGKPLVEVVKRVIDFRVLSNIDTHDAIALLPPDLHAAVEGCR